jgi:hypothetical protein
MGCFITTLTSPEFSFCRDQKTLLKKVQRLTRRNQRGISADQIDFMTTIF